MAQYRKKPVVINAVRWTGLNRSEITRFCEPLVRKNHGGSVGPFHLGFAGRSRIKPEENQVLIRTLEGVMTAEAGDWIIRGVKGEFYPCKPDIFAATYEAVECSGSPDPAE